VNYIILTEDGKSVYRVLRNARNRVEDHMREIDITAPCRTGARLPSGGPTWGELCTAYNTLEHAIEHVLKTGT
jgi:hypothetical protein